MSFYQLLLYLKRTKPEHIAYSFYKNGNKEEITVEQWVQDVFAFAKYALDRDMQGAHVAISCKNRYEWYVIAFGLIISGNVVVSINPDISEQDLIYQLETAEVKEVFYEEEGDLGLKLRGKTFELHKIEDIWLNLREKDMVNVDIRDYAEDISKLSLILFSSGTSGKPKGVMLSQKNMLAVCDDLQSVFGGGKMLLVLPLYHVGGIYFSLCFLRFFTTICICESPKYLIQDVQRFHPSVMPMVPAQLEFLVKKSKKNNRLLTEIKDHLMYVICVGATLENEYKTEFSEWNIKILNLYGLTETAGSLTAWFPHKEGSIGQFAVKNHMKLAEGELLVRGDSIMLGYYNNPEENAAVFEEGWMHTGDLVRIDEEGYLFLTGRKKNIIILSNGENISPEELESKILKIPYIQEVIVRGNNDVLEAVIFSGEYTEETYKDKIEESIKELNYTLPHFQQIKKITFREEAFEKTGSGKIKRNL